MEDNNFWDDIPAAAALLVRLSMQSSTCKKVAHQLDKSDSLIHKWCEADEPQSPNLEQWLKEIKFTRDLEGVRRLAEACGLAVVPMEVWREITQAVKKGNGA